MTSSLPQVAHEHHARIMHTVDTLPALGDDLMTKTAEELAPRVAEVDAFFSPTWKRPRRRSTPSSSG
jgi:hypothetical protein